jgi:shikimate dehydrogenase
MTGARPAIVVSLPGRSVAEVVPQIAEARSAGADLAEVRVDRWSLEARSHLSELFPSPIPLLATLRSAAEGGSGPDDPVERTKVLTGLSELPFRWIDLEHGRDEPLAARLPPVERLGRIVSCHLAASRAEEWPRRWLELSGVDGVGKLILPASVPLALGEILPRLEAQRTDPVVVHTIGPSGPLLRALSRRVGSPFVFAALPEVDGRSVVEPSQIPVDRLRPYLEADGEPPLFAVGGRPIAHSRSPALHSAWMRAEGRVGLYLPLEFASDDEFLASIPLLAANGFRGLNVTHPFKGAALEAATDAAPSARTCGAANCLSFEDGEVRAENTDLAAILRRLGELRDDGSWDGQTLSVLGAGGAARATLAAARILSARVTVYARQADAAQTLAQEFGARAASEETLEPASLAVHATPVGRAGSGPLDPALGSAIEGSAHVLDWVYRPEEAGVVEAARAAGATYEDGWRLFVYQAAASYAIWWGEEPAPDQVNRAIAEG